MKKKVMADAAMLQLISITTLLTQGSVMRCQEPDMIVGEQTVLQKHNLLVDGI